MDDLRKALIEDFGDKYFFGGIFPIEGEDPNCQMKIMRSGTKYTEIQNTKLPFPRGIGIDAFPIVSMPKGRLAKRIRKRRGLFLLHTIAVELEYRYPPANLLSCKDKKVKNYYRLRRFIGFFLSFKKLQVWKRDYYRYCVKKYKNSDFIAFGEGIWYLFDGKPITSSFLNPALFSFENHAFISLSQYDLFLKTTYGDYMKIPSQEHREKHVIYDIDFGDINL
jgi:lipopolysaccharide cholinephosphotransferase